MNGLLFWIVCLISGAAGFAMIYIQRCRITTAMIVGGAVAFGLTLVFLWLMPDEEVGPWFDVQLAVNGSVGLIFAGAGAAIGYALRSSRD